MVKNKEVQIKEGPEKEVEQIKVNDFVAELAALTYYKNNGSKVPFESLPEGERAHWAKIAGSVLISLDQMEKMVVKKVLPENAEARRNKNISILTGIIERFVGGLQTIRCPRCGSKAEVKAQLFPCAELANKILDVQA